jgi:3-deoxy-D-manno-octulosonic-acid transferase
MRLLYDIGIRFYFLVAWMISPWNSKARQWIRGRKGWKEEVRLAFRPEDRVVWFHCASLGEFEQGRPILESLREKCPDHKILLTFFSPSGYEKQKDYTGADHVMYLPLDTARNARHLFQTIHIEMAIFIKYEFWFHFLKGLKQEGVPAYLASCNFRPDQIFFRWYGGWYRKFFDFFTHIFVQQEASRLLLESHGLMHVSVAGDTRFDRVKKVAITPYENKVLADFSVGKDVIVAGSTWEPDEQLLQEVSKKLSENTRWIIAPHELSESHIAGLRKRFPKSVLFTELDHGIPEDTRVVIVNCIGQLSYLYRYGTLAYVGGGFGKGIHNILEAATYGLPVFFGPNHHKFSEAVELSALKGAFTVHDTGELLSTIHQQLENIDLLKTTSGIASNYVIQRVGATSKIVELVCKKTSDNML